MEKYFKLQNNEEIIYTASEVIIMANDNKYIANIIVTTKRIVLLQDIKKEIASTSIMQGRGTSIAPEYVVTYELNLNDIKASSYIDNYNKLSLKNNNILRIYCEDFIKYIS